MSISNNPLIKTGIKPKIYKNRDCKNRRVAIFFVLSVLMGLFTVVGHFGLFHSKKKISLKAQFTMPYLESMRSVLRIS